MIAHQTDQERMDWYDTEEFSDIQKMLVDGVRQVCAVPDIWLDEELRVSGYTESGQLYVEATLCDSCVRDGTPDGLNILIDIQVAQGGEGLKMYAPHNYTKDVWTDNIEELRQRIRTGMGLLPDEILRTEEDRDGTHY